MDDNARESDATAAAELYNTTVVPDVTPTAKGELAWSDEDEWAELPIARGVHPRTHSLARWGVAITATLIAAVTAAWFGTVLYRDVESKPAVAKSPPVVPTPEKTPTTPSPSAPAPPVETPHPAPTEAPVSPTPTAESITPKSETPLDDDARFLATISRIYNGAPIPDPALAILSAHKICEHLQEGSTTQRQAALDTMGASPGLSFETASILVEAVIDIYCPQFS